MSDSGLSIFDDDDEPDTGDTGATRTTGRATETRGDPGPVGPGPRRAARRRRGHPGDPGARAPTRPAPALAVRARTLSAHPATCHRSHAGAGGPHAAATGRRAGRAHFPVVRRGGYDKGAVDARVRQLTAEKSGLSSSLTESEKRVAGAGGPARGGSPAAEGEPQPVVRRAGRPGLGHAAAGGGGGRRDPRGGRARRRGHPHARQPRRRARSAPTPPARPRTCGWCSSRTSTTPASGCWPTPSATARWPRPRPRTCWPPPGGRPTRSGLPRSRRPTTCAPARSGSPSSCGPPPTARSRRPGAPSPSRRSGSPRRRPTTTPPPPPRPSAWWPRPSSARTLPRSAPAAATKQATAHRQQAQTEADATLDAGPPRGRADRHLGPHPGRVDLGQRHRRGRPRARRGQGRGRADDQAPRRDLRPAGLAPRRGRRLRRGRRVSTEPEAATTPAEDGRRPPGTTSGHDRHDRLRRAPASPFERHSPFYIGFFGGLGVLLAYWLGDAGAGDLVGPGPDRRGDVPRGRPEPGRGVLRSVAACSARGPCWTVIVGVLIALALFVLAIVPVISDQVASITENAPEWLDSAPAQPTGPGARREVRRHRPDPRLRRQGRLRRQYLRRRARRRARRARRRWRTRSS